MEISTNINLGTVSADIDVDVDDIGTHMQPWIESAVKSEVSDIDWDFLHDMIRDEFHNGTIEDLVSTAVSNGEAPSVDGAGIAEELLREYLGRDALGNSDETRCDLAHSFEKAVRLANQRNTRSNEGSGADYSARTTAEDVAALRQRLTWAEEGLGQLRGIVRRLAMSDLSHSRNTDHITSGLQTAPMFRTGVELADHIDGTTTDNTATDNTAPLLG